MAVIGKPLLPQPHRAYARKLGASSKTRWFVDTRCLHLAGGVGKQDTSCFDISFLHHAKPFASDFKRAYGKRYSEVYAPSEYVLLEIYKRKV